MSTNTFTQDHGKFADEAFRMATEEAKKKKLMVWRGLYSGFLYPHAEYFNCILVGIGSSGDKPTPPAVCLAISFDLGDGAMKYETDTELGMVPFGGGHHPLKVFQKLLEGLPDFSR